jgi:hypothetical protein
MCVCLLVEVFRLNTNQSRHGYVQAWCASCLENAKLVTVAPVVWAYLRPFGSLGLPTSLIRRGRPVVAFYHFKYSLQVVF